MITHVPSHKKIGFTLVELLVVIVVVISLAVLSVAGYRSVRMRANQSVSAANLRQLAAANLLYVADHQTYSPASDPTNKIRWHGGRSHVREKFDPEKGYLSEYLGFSRRVGFCPEFSRHLSDRESWENGSGGYGYNSTYIGSMPHKSAPNRPANVPNPARTLMFATTALAKAKGLQEYPFAEPPRSVNADWSLGGKSQPSVHFRFNGVALIAWCDGHVSEEQPNSQTGENFYGGANSNAEWKFGYCGPVDNNGWWNPRN